MAITWVANIAAVNAASGNYTASGLPSGTTSGDLLVVVIAYRGTQTWSPNNDLGTWTTVIDSHTGNTSTTASSGAGSLWVACCPYTGTTPNLTFTKSASGNAQIGCMFALRGTNTAGPVGNSSVAKMTAATTNANTASFTAANGSFLVMFRGGGCDATTSTEAAVTDPTTFTERVDANTTSGSDTTIMIATATKTGTGTTGTLTFTSSVSTLDVIAVAEFLPTDDLRKRYMIVT